MKTVSNSRHICVLIFLLLCAVGFQSMGQGITETRWYFGNSNDNLIFDLNGRGAQVQTDQAVPFGDAGSVTVTDQFSGNLLFYSDGSQVFDVSHALVPNGAGLNGDPTINNPAVVSPNPGSPGEYFLFTNSGNSGVNEIQYVVFDKDLQGNGSELFPYGAVVGAPVSTGLTTPADAMSIIPEGDGNTFWLLSQDIASNFELRVTPIIAGGTGTTVTYDFAEGDRPAFEVSQFSFNVDSSKLALAPKTANRNIWILDFDRSTGVLAFDTVLVGTGFDDQQGESIYDIEWSADGSKLYFSRYGAATNAAQLYQIDFLDSLGLPTPILPNDIFRSYGLQRAIDDRIYHLYQESSGSGFQIGRINRPDSIADSVQYASLVFPEDFQAKQFPSFTAGYSFQFDTLNFAFIDTCASNITKFFPFVDPVPNSLSWDFGDGEFSNNWIPNHEYQMAQPYTVSLTAEVGGFSQTITKQLTIGASALEVDLGNDTTICVDEVLILDAGTGTSFVWNTGDTTQTIAVDTLGVYWVEVTSGGCTDFDDIEVTEYGVAQQSFNQWYFGERAGIEFTGGPIALLDGNRQDAAEGCATISDVNGDLLFYTNGETIWNKEDEIMLNGDSIGGDQGAAQNALIMPFGGDQTIFYLFTTEQVYGDSTYALKYSIIDMKEDQAKGQVIVKGAKLMDHSTERVTGSGFDGNDAIVVHQFGNNIFRSFITSAEGLSGAIYSPVGEVHDFMNELSATGYMKISPTQRQIAVAIPGTGQVEILDYDNGEISNPRLIDTGEADLYGLEFSQGGSRLYLTTNSATSKLIQYDLDSLNSVDPVTDITNSKFDNYTQGAGYGALQIGPDGTVYMAVDNSSTIGTIPNSDADDATNGFDPEGFDLQGRISRLGLPNFAQEESNPIQEPSITISPACAGLATNFSAVGRDPNNQIESYQWIFGDGTFANVQDTTHIYNFPGTYTVQMVLSNRCDTDTTLVQTITVNSLPERPMVPTDTALCDQPIELMAWDVDRTDLSYYWSTGDTTRTLTVSQPALIDVAIINNQTGCSSDTLQVFVGDARPAIDLGEDLTLCQGDPTIRLNGQVAATSFEWQVDGVVSGSNVTFDIATDQTGIFTYSLEARNSLGCVARDTVVVNILDAPDITFVAGSTNACQDASGTLDLTVNSTGSFSYELTGPTPFGPENIDGINAAPQITSLLAGTYQLEVINLVTGCTARQPILIEDPVSFNLTATGPDACLNEGAISLAFGTVPANFQLEVVDDTGQNVQSATLTSTFSNPVATSLDTGTYYVSVREIGNSNCLESDTIRIGLADDFPVFTFDANQNFCGTFGLVTIEKGTDPNVIYNWNTLDGVIDGVTVDDTIRVTQNGTYNVTASGPGFCDRVEDIVVIISPEPTVSINVVGDACDGEIILESIITGSEGPFSYSWSDGAQTANNLVTESGVYTVTITDQISTCEVTSAPISVDVEQEFDMDLTLSPDCENEGGIFITSTTSYYDPAITYDWSGPNGTIQDQDSTISVQVQGTYTVTVTNETGNCVLTESINVIVDTITEDELILPEQASFCSLDNEMPFAELDAGVFNTYEWRLAGDTTIVSSDRVYRTDVAGTYQVTVYNGSICTTQEVELIQDCRPVVFAPNAFTPDGNGINDTFFIFKNDFIDEFQIVIFTRWGEPVYQSNDQEFRWDGIYKGSLLPPGTYAYVLKFTSSLNDTDRTFEQFGSITLVQ